MQTARVVFSALAIAEAGVMSMTAAEARHYRHISAYSDYVSDPSSCGPIPAPSSLYIYPEADWGPFFRHHAYRYGPIVSCALLSPRPRCLRSATDVGPAHSA